MSNIKEKKLELAPESTGIPAVERVLPSETNIARISLKSKRNDSYLESKYKKSLNEMPAPGTGLNPSLLKVASLAKRAGRTEDQFTKDVMKYAKKGSRSIKEAELKRAYQRASIQPTNHLPARPSTRMFVNHDSLLNLVGSGIDPMDLVDLSQVDIDPNDFSNWELMEKKLYFPFEHTFKGPLTPPYKEMPEGEDQCLSDVKEMYKLAWQKEHIKNIHGWRNDFSSPCEFQRYPFFIINPLTGEKGSTTDGKPSYRADSCISAFRYSLLEFDEFPGVKLRLDENGRYLQEDLDKNLRMQAGFWKTLIKAGTPIASIVHSGGKSLHILYKVNCRDRNEWNKCVRDNLFGKILGPLGVDTGCKNPSRLSRFPGHFRDDGKYQAMQKLLYLNPEYGKGVL
jgi:hypothetical protein